MKAKELIEILKRDPNLFVYSARELGYELLESDDVHKVNINLRHYLHPPKGLADGEEVLVIN